MINGKSQEQKIGKTETSPKWGETTKIIVGLSVAALIAGFTIRFQNILGPLLLAVIISYIASPLASLLCRWTKMPWRLAVTLIYLILVLGILGLLTWGGVSLVEEAQNLVSGLTDTIENLPEFFSDLAKTKYIIEIGPFQYDLVFTELDFSSIAQQILDLIKPVVSQAGSIVGSVASGAATTLGWFLFIVMVSYFLLAESGSVSEKPLTISVPGLQADIEHIVHDLGRTWNAFLRGQLVLVGITIAIYSVWLSAFGVKYAIGLAIIAGLARFLPWVGPTITWIVYFTVSITQGTTVFGLTPFVYTLIVLGVALVLDGAIDQVIAPKIMGNALEVHPAMLLVGALLGARMLGLVGMLLAAPVVATIKIIGTYAIRKLFDLDPWTGAVIEIETDESTEVQESPVKTFIKTRMSGLIKKDTLSDAETEIVEQEIHTHDAFMEEIGGAQASNDNEDETFQDPQDTPSFWMRAKSFFKRSKKEVITLDEHDPEEQSQIDSTDDFMG
jgi:predicted PurR-regulated permease PerM